MTDMTKISAEEIKRVSDGVQINTSEHGLNAVVQVGVGEYVVPFHTFTKSRELAPGVFTSDEVHREMAAYIYILSERLRQVAGE